VNAAIESHECNDDPQRSHVPADVIANLLADEMSGLQDHKNEYLRSGSRHPFIGGSRSDEKLAKALEKVVSKVTRPMMEEIMLEGKQSCQTALSSILYDH
jgi:hypothetical protein